MKRKGYTIEKTIYDLVNNIIFYIYDDLSYINHFVSIDIRRTNEKKYMGYIYGYNDSKREYKYIVFNNHLNATAEYTKLEDDIVDGVVENIAEAIIEFETFYKIIIPEDVVSKIITTAEEIETMCNLINSNN